MGIYQRIREAWKKPYEKMPELWKTRLIKWRREPATVKLDKPTRLDRARSLGYKAKQGIIVVRQKLIRGGHYREKIKGGRKPRRYGTRKNLSVSYKVIAEQRANRHYPNCEVLNSYWVAGDGKFIWYEVILVDRAHPAILSDKSLKWISEKKGRAQRGLTSAGKSSRGLRHKGKGAEKLRPSRKSNDY
ncbi:MAG: 50S ribosomal protein L15e [Candidatus Nanoarchaeia archaeon]